MDVFFRLLCAASGTFSNEIPGNLDRPLRVSSPRVELSQFCRRFAPRALQREVSERNTAHGKQGVICAEAKSTPLGLIERHGRELALSLWITGRGMQPTIGTHRARAHLLVGIRDHQLPDFIRRRRCLGSGASNGPERREPVPGIGVFKKRLGRPPTRLDCGGVCTGVRPNVLAVGGTRPKIPLHESDSRFE